MLLESVVIGAAVLCCTVLVVLGCVCHLFERQGFTNFEDEETGRDVSMYPTGESSPDAANVTFEPLPDILAKTVSSRALRPRITCMTKDKQSAAAKLVTVYKPFPRNQLLYVKEIGLGWFGQALQGSAEYIVPECRHLKVVVKILKDDATPNEKSLFLEEVAPYRDLDHDNIINLLGQCTETSPFLAVLEYLPLGDLKSYLMTNSDVPFIKLAIDAAKGLAFMHQHSYIHHDFAARNCLLTSDMQLKIGDYGIGEDLYREDYYDTGRDLLPIRWMSPESLQLKQGVWQLNQFTTHSNVWSLSVVLWEIISCGRRPYTNLRDEDVLQKVIKDGSTKLPSPNNHIPLHDRWFEIMEMCWQEVEDRPSAEDILAFLQQVEEELSSHKHSVPSPPVQQTDSPSHNFDSKFVMSKSVNQSNQYVAEVLVHRVDDGEIKQGFEDDFSQTVKIRKNKHGAGFEDDFVADADSVNLSDSSYLEQNDSVLAGGGNDSHCGDIYEQRKLTDVFSTDQNLLNPPIPVEMSTPSKPMGNSVPSQLSNTPRTRTNAQSSNYTTALDSKTNVSEHNLDSVRNNHRNSGRKSENSKDLFGEKSDTQTSDEGYRTNTLSLENTDREFTTQVEDSELDNIKPMTRLSPKMFDFETEKAKEIYINKGVGLPSTMSQKSRSLGTIPEDGIPSDNTSQSGVVFDEPEEDTGMNFEWDDYDGEQLVGRVRYMSDESNNRSPRHVEVEDWPFDQESGSEINSKPGSIASDSDTEVTRLSLGSNTSIDTRARIASILTNRLNSFIKQTNSSSSSSGNNSLYSFSQYDNDLDSPDHRYTDRSDSRQPKKASHYSDFSYDQSSDDLDDISDNQASNDSDDFSYNQASNKLDDTGLSTHYEEGETVNVQSTDRHTDKQDNNLIVEDLDKIVNDVLGGKGDLQNVKVSQPTDHMLPNTVTDMMV